MKTNQRLPISLLTIISSLSIVACGQMNEDPTQENNQWDISSKKPEDQPKTNNTLTPKNNDPNNKTPLRLCPATNKTVTVPTTIRDTIASGIGQVEDQGCGRAMGKEKAYTLYIDRPRNVRIWTTWENEETAFSPVLTLKQGCDITDEALYCSAPLQSKPDRRFNGWIQAKLEPGYYTLTIDVRSNDAQPVGGPFAIHLEDATLANQALCEDAQQINNLETITAKFNLDGTTSSKQSCFPQITQMHYYRIDVPARSTLSVESSFVNEDGAPSVYINTQCSASPNAQCPMGSRAPGQNGKTGLGNQTDATQTMIIAVSGRLNREYTIRPILQPLEDNVACGQAIPIESGTTLADQDFERAGVPEAQCNGNIRRSLYYSVEVPAFHRLYTSGAVLDIQRSCEAQTCIQDTFNNLPVSENWILRASENNNQSFDLSVLTVPQADNALCDFPVELSHNSTLRNQDIRQGMPHTGVCQLVMPAMVRYYTLPFIIGEEPWRSKIRVIPHDPNNYTASIEILNGFSAPSCRDATCVRVDDAYFRGQPVAEITAEYTDAGVGQETAYSIIAVSMVANDPSQVSTFDIEVTNID